MANCYELSEKEYSAVLQLEGLERYKHFVKRVSDCEGIWGLRNESGWVAAGDIAGNSGFPIWPHEKYAAACATGEWSGNLATQIKLQEFVELWLPNMENGNVQVAVFPTLNMKGVMVPARQLKEDLLQELSQYE